MSDEYVFNKLKSFINKYSVIIDGSNTIIAIKKTKTILFPIKFVRANTYAAKAVKNRFTKVPTIVIKTEFPILFRIKGLDKIIS